MTSLNKDDWICIGEALGPHGIKGAIWIRFFTSDCDQILKLKELFDEKEKRYRVSLKAGGRSDAILKAQLEGIDTRNDAEALRGRFFYIKKSDLHPLEEEEFYYVDLIGLKAQNLDGFLIGTILAIHNFGAQDTLEIKLKHNGKTVYVPFTKAAVPTIDLALGHVVIDDTYLRLDEAYMELFPVHDTLEKE
ncbi:MAG: ribosome maturation factor RimM [Candidatus Nucleicultricaceae bacterium]